MGLFKRTKSKRSASSVRVVSAVLVLGVLVLFVSELAKYLYTAQVPKSVTSKLDTPVEKLSVVLGTASTSIDSIYNIGSIFTSDTSDNSSINSTHEDPPTKSVPTPTETPKSPVLSIAIMSDSHNDLDYLSKALTKAKNLNISKVMFLGDYTDWGEQTYLIKSKEVMDKSGLDYFSLPGDHDLGETRDESNFVKVFGNTHGTWDDSGYKFMYFDNSKNFTLVSQSNVDWFKNNISNIDFLFLSQPLATSDMSRVMGIIDNVEDSAVFAQNKELLELVRNSKVKVIMSGDLHKSSHVVDTVRSSLSHYTVGAVLKSQSLEKLNLQSPRFSLLSIFEDGSYTIKDTPID